MSSAWDEVMAEARAERIVVPGATVEAVLAPADVGALGRVLAAANAGSHGLLVMGGRTRLHQANPARPLAAAVSLEAITGVDEFEPDEGVVHARAGTPIAALREVVAAEGWELPLDPPGASSTVGGTIASAATGPRAHAFGGVSDAILGLEVVGADGVASKCGGRVVKNVTGYDLAKLYCGSYGTLGIVTGAWLRLRPRPAVCEAVRAWPPSVPELFERCRALARLDSVRAILWHESPGEGAPEVVFELAGSDAVVAHDRERIAAELDVDRVGTDRVDALRDERAIDPSTLAPDEVVLRARALGSRSEALVNAMLESGLSVSVDLGLGVVHARGCVEAIAALERIRERAISEGGFAVVSAIAADRVGAIDVFGPQDGGPALARSLKARFDPAGILNPGRFVEGT